MYECTGNDTEQSKTFDVSVGNTVRKLTGGYKGNVFIVIHATLGSKELHLIDLSDGCRTGDVFEETLPSDRYKKINCCFKEVD